MFGAVSKIFDFDFIELTSFSEEDYAVIEVLVLFGGSAILFYFICSLFCGSLGESIFIDHYQTERDGLEAETMQDVKKNHKFKFYLVLAILFCVNSLYMPIVMMIFEIFFCSDDSYVMSYFYPNGNECKLGMEFTPYLALVAFAVVLAITFFLAIPIKFIDSIQEYKPKGDEQGNIVGIDGEPVPFTKKMYEDMITDDPNQVINPFNSLYRNFSPDGCTFKVNTLYLKVLLAGMSVMMRNFSDTAAGLSVSFVMAIFFWKIYVERPFLSDADNYMETFMVFDNFLLAICGVLSGSLGDGTIGASIVGIVAFVWTALTTILMFYWTFVEFEMVQNTKRKLLGIAIWTDSTIEDEYEDATNGAVVVGQWDLDKEVKHRVWQAFWIGLIEEASTLKLVMKSAHIYDNKKAAKEFDICSWDSVLECFCIQGDHDLKKKFTGALYGRIADLADTFREKGSKLSEIHWDGAENHEVREMRNKLIRLQGNDRKYEKEHGKMVCTIFPFTITFVPDAYEPEDATHNIIKKSNVKQLWSHREISKFLEENTSDSAKLDYKIRKSLRILAQGNEKNSSCCCLNLSKKNKIKIKTIYKGLLREVNRDPGNNNRQPTIDHKGTYTFTAITVEIVPDVSKIIVNKSTGASRDTVNTKAYSAGWDLRVTLNGGTFDRDDKTDYDRIDTIGDCELEPPEIPAMLRGEKATNPNEPTKLEALGLQEINYCMSMLTDNSRNFAYGRHAEIIYSASSNFENLIQEEVDAQTAYCQVFIDKHEADNKIVSDAFYEMVYNNPDIPRNDLEWFLSYYEKTPILKEIALADEGKALKYIFYKLEKVRKDDKTKLWYIFWDDFFANNEENFKCVSNNSDYLDPANDVSICYNFLTRDELDKKLKELKIRIICKETLDQLYKRIEHPEFFPTLLEYDEPDVDCCENCMDNCNAFSAWLFDNPSDDPKHEYKHTNNVDVGEIAAAQSGDGVELKKQTKQTETDVDVDVEAPESHKAPANLDAIKKHHDDTAYREKYMKGRRARFIAFAKTQVVTPLVETQIVDKGEKGEKGDVPQTPIGVGSELTNTRKAPVAGVGSVDKELTAKKAPAPIATSKIIPLVTIKAAAPIAPTAPNLVVEVSAEEKAKRAKFGTKTIKVASDNWLHLVNIKVYAQGSAGDIASTGEAALSSYYKNDSRGSGAHLALIDDESFFHSGDGPGKSQSFSLTFPSPVIVEKIVIKNRPGFEGRLKGAVLHLLTENEVELKTCALDGIAVLTLDDLSLP